MLIRRFFAFVISAFLIFFPAYSYANTSVGGWTALDTITAGANNTINATKTAGGKVLNSAITIVPQAGKVGKHLIKGGGSAALAFAMVELAAGAIDWLFDPANNRVTLIYPDADSSAGLRYIWTANDKGSYPSKEAAGDAVCNAKFGTGASNFVDIGGYSYVVGCKPDGYTGGTVLRVENPKYNPDAPPATYDRHIPIETVAAKVISNAEAGHAPSQEAVKATALEGFAAGEHDAALDAAATETGTENPPDTENPPKDPDAPPAPFDPSSIIAAINSLKAMLAGILSSMTGFFDWFQAPFTPPEEEKEEVGFATTNDVGLDDVDRFEKRITFSGQCPSNEFSFSMMGVTYAKPIPYHHLCGFLEQIAPWLLAMCYLGTAYFVVENI